MHDADVEKFSQASGMEICLRDTRDVTWLSLLKNSHVEPPALPLPISITLIPLQAIINPLDDEGPIPPPINSMCSIML